MDTGNNISAIFYITEKGNALANRLTDFYPEAAVIKFAAELVPEVWRPYKCLVFIMAAGIVVRTIAPLIKDKRTDPAIVVLDEKGDYAISLLSGHLGGANRIAKDIASFIGAQEVITTASDINELPSIDLWAKENSLVIENWDQLPKVAVRLLNEGNLRVYSETDITLPAAFVREPDPNHADVLITEKYRIELRECLAREQLYLRPRRIILGIGCNSGTSLQEIEDAVRKVLLEHNLSFLSACSIATIDKKANEPGLTDFSRKYDLAVRSFPAAELNKVHGIEKSGVVFQATGAHAVAEPAALLASGTARLLVSKQKSGNVTVAVALSKSEAGSRKPEKQIIAEERKSNSTKMRQEKTGGRLFIVGIGPGCSGHITSRAKETIKESDVVVGYGTYLDLISDLVAGKEIFTTGMTHEVERCNRAIELACAGKTVSIISGGDPGIYAMAGLVYEILRSQESGVRSRKSEELLPEACASELAVEVIPGVSASNAAAAKLGAPLMHDFASVSLSDRLTPWQLIEERLDAAAMADFVIVLYNPRSKGRREHFSRAIEIISRHRRPGTPVGVVKAAMRADEEVMITDLEKVSGLDIDMQTTVIVGNSKTFVWNGRMITPRGYESKSAT